MFDFGSWFQTGPNLFTNWVGSRKIQSQPDAFESGLLGFSLGLFVIQNKRKEYIFLMFRRNANKGMHDKW